MPRICLLAFCLQRVLRGSHAAVSETWSISWGSVYVFFLLSMYPTSICIMCTDIIVPRGEISLLDIL